MPGAERAWRPRSPYRATKRSEAPSTTRACPVKVGALLTMGNPVEVAQFGLHPGQQVQGGPPRRLVALLHGQVVAQLAGNSLSGGEARADSGEPHDVAAAGERQVVAHGIGRGWQFAVHLDELCFDLGHFGLASCDVSGSSLSVARTDWR